MSLCGTGCAYWHKLKTPVCENVFTEKNLWQHREFSKNKMQLFPLVKKTTAGAFSVFNGLPINLSSTSSSTAHGTLSPVKMEPHIRTAIQGPASWAIRCRRTSIWQPATDQAEWCIGRLRCESKQWMEIIFRPHIAGNVWLIGGTLKWSAFLYTY